MKNAQPVPPNGGQMSYGINTKAIEVLQMSGLGNFGLDKLGLENAREKFARAVLK